MMKAMYVSQQGANMKIEIMETPEVQKFVETHAAHLDSSFQKVDMSDAMRSRLQRSDYVFSGMKTFHELNEAFPSMLDENGNRKPFERFLSDVRKIDSTYNSNYLNSEYNFVTASGQMAAKWERFQRDGDRYNLQYRTARDKKVRPEHQELDGVTLPMSDPFWEEYYPPNGWNCRCDVIQVLRNKYPETPHDEAMARGESALQKDKKGMFSFNPGIEQKTVPDYNPYTIRRCKDCDIAKGKLDLAFVPENELCAACELVRKCEAQRFNVLKEFENGGKILVHQLVNHEDSDYSKLISIAEHFASLGKEVKLTPKMSRPPKFVYQNIYGSLMGTKYEGKCPDLLIDDVWYEHEGFTTDNPKNAFRNMMRDGLRQSDRLIIDKPELTTAYMKRVIWQRVQEGHLVNEIWLKDGGVLTLLYKKFEE